VTLILALVQEFHITKIRNENSRKEKRKMGFTLRKFNITDVNPLRVTFLDN
jgi:hypothetical protein